MLIDNLLDFSKKALKYRLILQKPTYEEICQLEEAYNIEYQGSLLSLNKLSFNLPFVLDGKRNDNIDKVQSKYLIYLELYEETTGLIYQQEYFIIQTTENIGDEKDVKKVSCISLAYQLASKLIKGYSGSKKLYRTDTELAAYSPSEEFPTIEDFRESGILNTVTRLAPSWTILSVPAEINETFRDFDVDSASVIDFLMNTAMEAFEVIFEFDTINKIISVKPIDSLGSFHGFFLSENSLIKSITETVNIDDITTKLFVYGKEAQNIRTQNILGEEYIMDLSYFRNRNFMSQSLLDSLDLYDVLTESKQPLFQSLMANLTDKTEQLADKNTELITLQEELELLEKEKNDLISDEEDLTDINSQIDAKDAEIATVEDEISALETDIAEIEADLEDLQLLVLMQNNFTIAQIEELDFFVHEKEIRNESISDPAELYEYGLKVLQKNNQPVVQLDLDTVSLFDCVECSLDWDKLRLGDTACIHYDLFNVDIELRIINYLHNSENNKLTITFGNRQDINNPNMLYEEIRSSMAVTTTLDYNKNAFLDYTKNDKSKINAYITNALDLAMQGAKAASNQSVSIDQRGITLTNPANLDYQVKMINDLVVFTRDGWQTASIALSADRGIVAESVSGLLGQFCQLRADQIVVGDYGEGLSEEVLGDSVVLQNTEYNRVTINTDEGIKALHPADNSYTQMNGDGFLRFIPTPNYNEQSLSADTENFNGASLGSLQLKGWEFSTCKIDSNRLRVGNTTGSVRAWARINKYITKNNTTFNFSYTTAADQSGDSEYLFYIDNTRYDLGYQTTSTTFQSRIGGTVNLSKGWHTFIWYSFHDFYSALPSGLYMHIDDITFEQNPVLYNPSGTYNLTGSTYNYLTYSGTGTTPNTMNCDSADAVPDVWVQLPDEFKGKQFKVDVFLQDTGEEGADYCVNRVFVEVVKDGNGNPIIDYANARFKVRARLKRTYYWLRKFPASVYPEVVYDYELMTVIYFRGCDFTYIVTV